ncbi:hypothetical protein MoryE10_01130 [Methylogaea oryzae]|uniref:Uncharacterized protein n=1 Tax=Methylogaea oryzae TaxID=1295382 RepID=A0A8D4VMY2_9GAMM|nr:hypothetical protein MoryE10_01130 [Methylogaea oryzae]
MASAVCVAWGGEYYGRLGGGAAYDDNVTRGADNQFRRGDFSYRVSGVSGVDWRLGERLGLALEARVDGSQYQRFERLSSLRGVLLARALFKPFDGYTAPWFALESEGGAIGHKDSALRDRWEWSGRALAGARLTDRLSASLGYQYGLTRGAQWGVWNTDTHALLTSLQYALTPKVNLFVDYRLTVGKHNATAAWSQGRWSYPAYDVRWRDKALEADTGVAVYAYRMDGVSHQVAVGGAWDVGHRWGLELAGRYFVLDGEAGASYQGLGGSIGANYRF